MDCTGKVSILHGKSMCSGIRSFAPVVGFVNHNIGRFVLTDIAVLFADHLLDVYFHCVLLS